MTVSRKLIQLAAQIRQACAILKSSSLISAWRETTHKADRKLSHVTSGTSSESMCKTGQTMPAKVVRPDASAAHGTPSPPVKAAIAENRSLDWHGDLVYVLAGLLLAGEVA